MHLPSPSAALELAAVTADLAGEVAEIGQRADHLGEGAWDCWHGEARDAFANVMLAGRDQLSVLERALSDFSGDLGHLQTELQEAQNKLDLLNRINEVSNLALVASVLQLGLDPASDTAAFAGKAGVRTALAEARHLVERAIARLVASLATRAVELSTIRGFGRFVLPRIASAAVISGALQELLDGGLSTRQTLEDSAMGVFLGPGTAGAKDLDFVRRVLRVMPRGLDLAAHEGPGLGHTLERHVGKSADYLIDRLRRATQKTVVSSFASSPDAQAALVGCVRARLADIETWFAETTDTSAIFRALLPESINAQAFRIDRATNVVTHVTRSQLAVVEVRLTRQGDEAVVRSMFVRPLETLARTNREF